MRVFGGSDYFKQLALKTQILSPQILTYVHMITTMEMKEYCHLLGGEVRYRTNYLNDDGSATSLVMLNKVSPGYNGMNFTNNYSGNASSIPLQAGVIFSFNADGSWSASQSTFPEYGNPDHVLGSGAWATPPLWGQGYEYRIVSISGTPNNPNIWDISPSSATAWLPIPQSISVMFNMSSWSGGGHSASASNSFSLQLRPINKPTQIISSSFSMTLNVSIA